MADFSRPAFEEHKRSGETMQGRLEGKTAVVTAAGAGIGRAVALAFAKEGARTIATDINSQALETLAAAAPNIETQVLNMLDPEAVAAFAAAQTGVNVLFNCAGIVHDGSILRCTEEDWTLAFDLNVRSMFRLTKALLPSMVERGGGSIVNIASVAGSVKGIPSRFVYGCTKAAVIGLTKSVAIDFIGQGIRCNAICPGTIDTPSLGDRMRATGDEAKARAAFTARQPMGRLGRPEEVAELAVYLASDLSGFTTGAIHMIDGGMTI
jgi:2-keto-3-deoxy-L-fuconate dehydrogenase